MNTIEKAIKHLLDRKQFYAHYFLNSKITYCKGDNARVPTAAAGIDPKTLSTFFIFNEDFIASLSFEEFAGVVEHEIMHQLFSHTSFFNQNVYNKQIMNIAMDCAINQYIDVLPEGSITLPSLSSMLGEKLDPFETWEYYYSKIIQSGKVVYCRSIDEHEGDTIDGKLSDAVLRSNIDKAIKASKGNAPEHVLKIYSGLVTDAKICWKGVLKNFVARAVSYNKKATRKKINRRFGLDAPGTKKLKELTLGVCVDSSGSVDDAAFESFVNEVVHISSIAKTTYFIDADCEVQNVQKILKRRDFEKSRSGSGGTAYSPAIEKCMELKCDAIIYFGDFDTADTPVNPGVPFLWVGLENGIDKPGDFGQVIRINNN